MRIFIGALLSSFLWANIAMAQPNDEYLQTQLEQLHQKLEASIHNAPANQKFVVLQQAHYWLYALNAFSNVGTLSIFDKMEKLDATELAAYNSLESHILAFAANNTLADAKTLATEYVSKLPVVKNQFEVNPTKPLFFFVGNTGTLEVTVTGSFPLLLEDPEEVYLYTANHKVSYTSTTDTSITFRFAPAQLGLDKVNLLMAKNIKLRLVGQVGRKINKKKQFTSIYDLYAMPLPTSPGKLTITQSSTASNSEKQTKRTRTFLLNGSKGNLVEKQCIPLHDGWNLLPETVDLVVESSTGQKNRDWNYRKTTTGGKTCFTAEVFFNSSGPSGKLEYHLKYEIARNTTEAKTDTSEVELSWGEMRQLNFDMPVVSVVYTDFMGNSNTMDGNSYQSDWLQLELQDKSLALKTLNISLNPQP